METQVRTPDMVFMQPQRLTVPLFQRPYVWNEESQWKPLWEDIVRVTERFLSNTEIQPHFLGAVVLQQVLNPVGSLQERTIIDGQQRLTTLQLLLDALHREFLVAGAVQSATRIETLVRNQPAFCERNEDRFKVWPTNRDRSAFNAVMSADAPVAYEKLEDTHARLVQAHRYFATQARLWMNENGGDDAVGRAVGLEKAVRELLQIVVIDLGADENAQEIFETLNARGTPLTAADLIKNFVFQRLIESGTDVEAVYEGQWRDFETGFWETEIQAGRVRYPRSAVFLNQWLIAKTGEEIVAREVFARFKRYADFDSDISMIELVGQIHRSAVSYQAMVVGAGASSGPLSRVELFTYRTSALESEVIKPFLLFLLDPDEPLVPSEQLFKALDVVESWMVRRMLVRATSQSYGQLVAELITQMRKCERSKVGDVVEEYLRDQAGNNRYWPDDQEIRDELETLLAYRRLRRGRVRMVLEAVEDHRRGWISDKQSLGSERVSRDQYAIEHVMPQQWLQHWDFSGGPAEELERDRLVNTFGNLTLLTGRLNSKVSNGPWIGDNSKRKGIHENDALFMNRDLLELAGDDWNESKIRQRTMEIAELIIDIWPVPEGHRSVFSGEVKRHHRPVEVVDLINAGMLEVGQLLYPRSRNPKKQMATVLGDGSIEVNGQAFGTPSGAAGSITGGPANGWWYFLLNSESPQESLGTLRDEYVERLAIDVVDEDEASEGNSKGATGHRFPSADYDHTCTGGCGRTLEANKFPTISGQPWRLSECRECRDLRTAAAVDSQGAS